MKDPADDSQSEYTMWKVTINKDADGFRLPSSDEWEYACKAGTATKYYWGDTTDFSVINQYSVSNKDFDEKNKDKYYGTERVGSKKPNAWGLYDMSGNVSEWCFDWHPEYKGYHRIVHGGNWYPDETFALLMSGKADYSQPHIGKNTIGFRVVKKL